MKQQIDKKCVDNLFRILRYNKENNIFPRNITELAEALNCHRTTIYCALKNGNCGSVITQLKLWLADNDQISKYDDKLIFDSGRKCTLEKYNFTKRDGKYYGNSFAEGNFEFRWFIDSDNVFKLSVYDKKKHTEILLENLGFIADLVKKEVINKEYISSKAKI